MYDILHSTVSPIHSIHIHTGNPIKQDVHDDGSVRYYQYGNPCFNYGLIPQTFEDPVTMSDGYGGDNDPLDIIELGSTPLPVGTVFKAKVGMKGGQPIGTSFIG